MNYTVLSLREIEPDILLIIMEDKINKNTFSKELIDELLQIYGYLKQDNHYKAVILTGYDSYFASGGTKKSLLAIHKGEEKFTDNNIYSLALECQIPVIAAMQGHGIGGGFIMGLFADFIIFSRESIYTANFMKYGFTPGMGATYILPKKFGIGLGEEMLLNAGTYRGAELEKRGIPFPVLPRNEVLDYAIELAKQVSEKPRNSLITLKRHLVTKMREELPAYIDQEIKMHDITFHQSEVSERIYSLFGK